MGKDNKAQRTKNNAKPSSSGRSAELLHSQMLLQGQMFTAVKDVGLLPTFTSIGLEDMDSSVAPDFQMALKRMNKKDSTTKMKALQEFTELVNRTGAETLKAVLPFWPRIYCQLATDSHHRVRELTHLAQLSIVQRAKRNIAPQLKQMIGPWFTGQHDMYAPAASAALTAFNEAFTGDAKQAQAVEFCQSEILAYIKENIVGATNQAGKSSSSDEDSESRHQRALSSSLQGYTLYLQKLPPDVLLAAREENEAIVNSKQFVKLSKHAVPLVRGSWFSCLAALCVKAPHLLTPPASLAVLSSLDDSDATVLPLVWDAALHLVVTNKEAWSHVSVDKLVLPKMLATLRNGCHGNAAAILPGVLPMISQLPAAFTGTVFYEKLCESLRQGFSHKMAVQSQSECNALAKCYVECCRYAILKNQSDDAFCRDVVEKQLIAAIALTLTDVRLSLLASPLCSACVPLLHHWDRLECPLLGYFWTALEPIVTQPIEYDTPDWSVTRRVDLVLSMRSPKETKCGARVTFRQDSTPAPPPPPTPPTTTSLFSAPLSALATSLSLLLAPLPASTPDLARLLASFSSSAMFEALASPRTKIEWFHEVVANWLTTRTNQGAGVVDVALLLVAWLDDAQGNEVLEALATRCSGTSLCHLLTSCCAVRAASVRAFMRHGRALTPVLTRLARDASAESIATLVLVATSVDDKGDRLISDASLSHVVTLACSAPRLDLAVSLVEALGSDQSAVSSLVVALFSGCLKGRKVGGAMAVGAGRVAEWGAAGELMARVQGVVATHIASTRKSDSIVEVERCVDSVHQLLTALALNQPADLATLLDRFLSLLSRQYDELAAGFTQLCDSGVMEVHSRHLFNQSGASDHKLGQSGAFTNKSGQSEASDDKFTQSDSYEYQLKAMEAKSNQSESGETISGQSETLEVQMQAMKDKYDQSEDSDDKFTQSDSYEYQLKAMEAKLNQSESGEAISGQSVTFEDQMQALKDKYDQLEALDDDSDRLEALEDKSIESECLEGPTEEFSKWNDGKDIVNKTEADICEELDLFFSHSLMNAKLMARLFPSTNQNAGISEPANGSEDNEDDEIEVFKTRAIKKLEEDVSTNQSEAEEPTNPGEDDASTNLATCEAVQESVAVRLEEEITKDEAKIEAPGTEDEADSNVDSGEMFRALQSHVLRLVSCVSLSRSLSTRYASTMLNFQSAKRRSAIESTAIDMLQGVGSTHIKQLFTTMIDIWQDFCSRGAMCVYASLPVSVQLSASKLTSLLTDRVTLTEMKEMDRQVVRCWDRCKSDAKPYDVLTAIPTQELLYDSPVWKASTSYVETVSSTTHYLTYLVKTQSVKLTPELWDFIFISTASWMLSVNKSRRWLLIGREDTTEEAWVRSHRSAVLAVNTFKLLHAVTEHLKSQEEQEEGKRRKQEWEEVFLPEIRDILCQLFIELCERDTELSVLSTPVQKHLGRALHCVDVSCYTGVDKLTSSCLRGLRSQRLIVQYTAFQVLSRLCPILVKQDAVNEESPSARCHLHDTAALLAACSAGVDATLADTRLGEQRDVTPHGPHGSHVLGYLLAAHAVLDMCDVAHDSLTSQYALHLRETGLLAQLLQNLLRLMPARVLDSSEARSKSSLTSLLFTSPVNTGLGQAWTVETVHHLACRVYWLLLSRLPAEVRGWWCNCDQRTLVERVTTRFVSPALCDLEMQQVRSLAAKQVNKYDNMKIKVHGSVREVTAVYTVDEARMELVIALPSNHPLGLVKIETPRNVVSSTQARTWLMQLTMFLTCQNGSLWNGLSLWKSNLDKRFEGIEECYICFSVLSGSNFQLPRVCCRTCKKKFHSGCLFKWFSTSNKSSCPVCRNMF